MKPFTYIVSSLFLVILTFAWTQPAKAEVPDMHVLFVSRLRAEDKETGEKIKFVDRKLYSLPDTTYIGDFYGIAPEGYLSYGRHIDAAPGSQFLVRASTMNPQRRYCHDDNEYETLVKYIKEKQGLHETIWLGPFTIPDTVNTYYGIVKIMIQDIRLKRLK